MRILITNIVVLNGGDGAILFGMLKALRRSFGGDCEFVVFASEPQAAKRMYPEIEFREALGLAATRAPQKRYLGRIIRTIRSATFILIAWCYARGLRFVARWLLGAERARDFATYASADLVISSGGTYLKEDYGVTSQVCDYRITLLLGRPLAFYTQTLGPFKHPASQAALAPIFNAAVAVLLRDEQSRKNLLEIGVRPDRLRVSPDAAFALADLAGLERAAVRKLPTDRPLRIVLSVRHWSHFKGVWGGEGMERYLSYMAELTRWLVNDLHAEVTFLSTCQGNSEYPDDSEIAVQVVAQLEADVAARVAVVREFVRFDALLERLPHFDLVLATRMHMAILSLMAGVPAIPLALEFKTNELYAGLGLAEWVVNVEEFDQAAAKKRILGFLAGVDALRPNLFQHVSAHRNAALQGGGQLREMILGRERHKLDSLSQ